MIGTSCEWLYSQLNKKMPIRPSIIVEYFRKFTNIQLPNAILVYNFQNSDIISFLDNLVIIQDNRIVLLDPSAPLTLVCSNSARYIEMSMRNFEYTAYCGQDSSVWSKLIAQSIPTALAYTDFVEWKKSSYPDDTRVLIQHVINYVYSTGLIRSINVDIRRRLHL